MTITGIAGTAKNTGKTTTLNSLAALLHRQGSAYGVTGIGYDGETTDSVTRLPKPRITLHTGAHYCTAEQCFDYGNSTLLQRTGILNPLGELLIGRVTREGLFTIAGPQTLHQAQQIISCFAALQPHHLLIDGSLNRLYPLSSAERLLFATGCSRATDAELLEREIQLIVAAFTLPCLPPPEPHQAHPLLTAYDMERLVVLYRGRKEPMQLTGHIHLGLLLQLLRNGLKAEAVVLPNALTLLLQADSTAAELLIAEFGGMLALARRHQLLGFTLNPFYPAFNGTGYTPRYGDISRLLTQGSIPRIDIVAGPERFTALARQWFIAAPKSS